MSPLERSRRLQLGLAGLSVVSALGAALGLGLTTHTQSSQTGQSGTDGTTGSSAARVPSHHSVDGDDDDEGDDDEGDDDESSDGTQQQSSPVTPPTDSEPQATTGGS
jgi:hypothetical protein